MLIVISLFVIAFICFLGDINEKAKIAQSKMSSEECKFIANSFKQYQLTKKGEALAEQRDNKLAKFLLYVYLIPTAIGVIYLIYSIATV